MGRGNFSEAQAILHLQSKEEEEEEVMKEGITFINDVRYIVFDVISSEDFESRFNSFIKKEYNNIFRPFLVSLILIVLIITKVESDENKIPAVVKKSNNNNDEMRDQLSSILKQGGEGIVARLPSSLYHHGRTDSLVKFKVY